MKANKVSTLYFFTRLDITGSPGIASSTSYSDNTKVWHMSERGVTILRKRGLLYGQSICKMDFWENYVFGKQKRLSFSMTVHSTKVLWITSIQKVIVLITCFC